MNSKRPNKILLVLVGISILLLALLGLHLGDVSTDSWDIYNAIFSYSDDNLSELIIR